MKAIDAVLTNFACQYRQSYKVKEIPSKDFNRLIDEWIHREIVGEKGKDLDDCDSFSKIGSNIFKYSVLCSHWLACCDKKKRRKIAREIQKLIIANCVYEEI